MIATRELWLWSALGRALGRGSTRVQELVVSLGEDATWSAQVARPGVEIRCLSGSVWLTREGDPEDHVLTSGASLVSGRAGRLALLALEPARVQVVTRR
jgi:hypothetical protein